MRTTDKVREIDILECTLRDGSYAVDFRFTEQDTRLLTGLLAGVGFRWIEVGHGLGLGAADAGKGRMPTDDATMIAAARKGAKDARIGVFCIPGIARQEMLTEAREAGLDFVRIGQNPEQIDTAYPFIERAAAIGLVPIVNVMKSYAIPPTEFGRIAAEVTEAGPLLSIWLTRREQ